MSLASDLGYVYPQQNWFQRVAAWIFATTVGSWVSFQIGHHLDRWALKLTGGRTTLSGWLTALPPIWVTTIGARSGLQRRVPLLGIPVGDDLALIGSGFGQVHTPGWVYNLEADPHAVVEYRDIATEVIATQIEMDDATVVWATAERIYPGYAGYRRRAGHRMIRVFMLHPA